MSTTSTDCNCIHCNIPTVWRDRICTDCRNERGGDAVRESFPGAGRRIGY